MTALGEDAIFDVARQISSQTARDAYLEQACGGNGGLRARVDELLAAHDAADSRLDSPPIQPTAAHSDPSPVERPGAQIGPYKLLQEIGEGGMGVVFMAEQTAPVERRVALKIIKPGMDSRQVIARFEAERQALAMMDHPNIAKILDAGTTESGRPYFVMELVKGTPITKYCDDAHLTTRERLELFLPVCYAVQHAHHKGVIHRDIKPSNVLVALYDDRAVPKVIDFGVAKATHRKLTDKTMFTRFGEVVGTLEYMSPEQAQLNQLDIDTRSDIYSLGVLLYELLTGCTPFDKQRLHTAAFEEVLRIIREEEPPKPSTRLSAAKTLPDIAARRKVDPQQLKHLVRGELDWSVMKALEKDRSRRYDTAGSFADDIRRHLNGEPILACPTPTFYRIRRFARRHRIALCVGGAIACIMVLATIVSSWYAHQAIVARDAVELSLDGERVARRDAEAAQQQAVSAKQDADGQRAQAERSLYIAHMNQAWQAWRDGNLQEAQRLVQLHSDDQAHASRGPEFEWRFLRELCRPKGHLATYYLSGVPAALSLSCDGRHVAVCDVDGEVSIVNTESHERHRYATSYKGVTGHAPYHAYVSFSADGRYLISPGKDTSTPIIVDTLTMASRPLRSESSLPVLHACFRPATDAAQLAVARQDGAVSLLADCLSGEVLHMWRTTCDLLVFSPDGKYLAGVAIKGDGVGASSEVTVWDLSDFSTVMSIPSDIPVRDVAFSPDSKLLGAIHAQNSRGLHSAAIWRVPEGDEVARGPDHEGFASCIAFLPDGTLATGGRDNAVRLHDIVSGCARGAIRGHSSYVTHMATVPVNATSHPQVVATAGSDNRVMLWQVDTHSQGLLAFDSDHPVDNQISHLVFTPDSRTLLGIKLFKHRVYQWNATTLEEIASWQIKSSLASLAVSRNRMVAAGCWDGTVLLWSLGDETGRQQFSGTAPAMFIDFSPDGTLLASPGQQAVMVWDTQSQHLSSIPVPLQEIYDLRWNPDGRLLAVGGYKSVVVLDTNEWTVVAQLKENRNAVYAISFSSDGRLLATAGMDSTICVWDTRTWHLLHSIRTHSGYVWGLVFSRDGRALFSTSGDDRVAVWDVETGNLRLAFDAHVDGAKALALSPDESMLATGGLYDGTIRLWRAPAVQDDVRPSIFDDSEWGALESRIASAPPRADLLLQRAQLSLARGDRRNAQEDLEAAVDLDPAMTDARIVLAQLYQEQGNVDKALEHLQRVPDGSLGPGLREQRARLLAHFSRWDEAARDASHLLDLLPNERQFNSERSKFIEVVLREYPRGFPALVQLRPSDSQLLAVQARDLAVQSDWEDAARIYSQIVDTCPAGEEWYEHAALRLLVGDRNGYDAFVARVLPRVSDTNDPMLTYAVTRMLALACPPAVDGDQLAGWAERTVAENRIDWKLHVAGLAFYRAGKYEKAIEHYLASQEGEWTDAGDALNHLGLALAYHRLDRQNESRAVLQKALAWGEAVETASVERQREVCALDWLEFNVLRQEASDLLEDTGDTEKGK